MKPLHWIVVLVAFFSVTLGTAAEPEPRKTTLSKEKPVVRTVAILLFEGVELLDFAGPAEVFIVAAEGKAYRVVTVADSMKPLKSMGGITLTPDFSYTNAPKVDILVVPSRNMKAVGQAGREWIV